MNSKWKTLNKKIIKTNMYSPLVRKRTEIDKNKGQAYVSTKLVPVPFHS